MKHLLWCGAALLLPAATASCCHTDILTEHTETASRIVVEAVADTPSTRAFIAGRENDRYPVRWDGGERFTIVEFTDGVRSLAAESYDLAVSEDGSSATFRFDLTAGEGERFDYYASTFDRFEVQGDEDMRRIVFDLPSEQVQTSETSPAGGYIALVAANEGNDGQSSDMSFRFRHAAAYGRITVQGLNLSDGERIREAVFSTTDAALAGRIEYLPSTQESVVAGEASQEVRVDVSPFADGAFAGRGAFDVWFASAAAEDIGTFVFKVTTGNGDAVSEYSKRVVIADADRHLAFRTGACSSFTVNMAGIAPLLAPSGSTVVYTLNANGEITAAGAAPADSRITYTQDDSPRELERNQIGTLTLHGYRNVEIYLRASCEGRGRVMVGMKHPEVESSTPKDYLIYSGDANNDLTLTIRNSSEATVSIDAFAVVMKK